MSVVNLLTTQIRNLLKQWRTAQWHDKLRAIHGDYRKFWKLLKTSTRKRNSTVLHDGDNLLTSAEQAEKFADHYSDIITKRTGPQFDLPTGEADNNFMYVSPKQLKTILRRSKGNKSPGHDEIQTVLLKQLPRRGIAHLTNLYNSCLRLRYFPETWKRAILFPLLKPTKTGTLPVDYRPVSLLPSAPG